MRVKVNNEEKEPGESIEQREDRAQQKPLRVEDLS